MKYAETAFFLIKVHAICSAAPKCKIRTAPKKNEIEDTVHLLKKFNNCPSIIKNLLFSKNIHFCKASAVYFIMLVQNHFGVS